MTMEQYQQWLQSPDGQKWQASQQPVMQAGQGFMMAGGQFASYGGQPVTQAGQGFMKEAGDLQAVESYRLVPQPPRTEYQTIQKKVPKTVMQLVPETVMKTMQRPVVRYEKQKKTRMVNKVIQVEEEYEVEVGVTETETFEVPYTKVTQVPVETEEIVNEVVAVQVEQEPVMEKYVQYVQPVKQYEYKEVEVPVEEYEEVEVEETAYEYQWSGQVRAMDVNNDGKVSSAEFQTWMAQQSSAQQAAMLKAMDANHDGKVTMAEQQAFLQRQMSQGSFKAPWTAN